MRRLQMELEKKPHEICAQNELQDLSYLIILFPQFHHGLSSAARATAATHQMAVNNVAEPF